MNVLLKSIATIRTEGQQPHGSHPEESPLSLSKSQKYFTEKTRYYYKHRAYE